MFASNAECNPHYHYKPSKHLKKKVTPAPILTTVFPLSVARLPSSPTLWFLKPWLLSTEAEKGHRNDKAPYEMLTDSCEHLWELLCQNRGLIISADMTRCMHPLPPGTLWDHQLWPGTAARPPQFAVY